MLVVFIIFIFNNPSFAGANEKRYELPNHGELLINVPGTWKDQIKYPPGDLPPTIRFSQKSGEKFTIVFTPLWKMPTAPANFGTAESIQQLVKGAASSVSSQAVEKNIEVKKINGSNVGFYFSATDKAPKPGEYKYMTQGAIGVNEIMGRQQVSLTHSRITQSNGGGSTCFPDIADRPFNFC